MVSLMEAQEPVSLVSFDGTKLESRKRGQDHKEKELRELVRPLS